MGNILIVAAHPDDEVLGCGGIIASGKCAGDRFFVLFLTNGGTGRYNQNQIDALRACSRQANKILGTEDIFFEDFPNQALETLEIIKINKCVESYVEKIKPVQVYTHHIADLNRDHRVVAESVKVACRPLPGQPVKELLNFFTPSSTEWNLIEGETPFIPNVFVNIEGVIEKKIEAMQCYKSECHPYPHPRSPEGVRTYANFWGLTVGMKFAEPFKLIRSLR